MSNCKVTAVKPDGIEFKFEITLTLGEWKQIRDSMARNWLYPMTLLANPIRDCISQAEESYQPEDSE